MLVAAGTRERMVIELIATTPVTLADVAFRSKEESTLDVAAIVVGRVIASSVETLALGVALLS